MKLRTFRTDLYALMIILISIYSTNAQRPPASENARQNFREIQKHYNEKFAKKRKPRNQRPDEKDRDDEEVKFRRFEEFWTPRVDERGEFTTYYKNLKTSSEKQDCDNCAVACNKTKWNLLGPASMPGQNMGAIQSIWVNPKDPAEILAGTYSAGLYRTTNGGGHWDKLTVSGCKPDCSDFPISGGVMSIAVNPNDTRVIYITVGIHRGMDDTNYSYGVYKTVDGGLSWCPTDLKFDPSTEYAQLKKVIMDPNDPNILFAIAGNKIYKTTNAGAIWKSNVIYTASNNHEIQDIAISRNAGNTGLYFSEAGDRCFSNTCQPPGTGWNCPLTNGKIWYNPNFNGAPLWNISFTALGIGSFPGFEVQMEKALFSVTPNSVSILALSDFHAACPLGTIADRIIARNFNTLPTISFNWTKHLNPPGAGGSHGSGFASAFAVSPLDPTLVFLGSDNGGAAEDLYISRDGGASFTPQYCLHPDLRTYAFAEKTTTGERWIIGNDGGVGDVSGISAAPLPTPTCKNINNTGLTVTDLLGFSNSETDPTRIYAGAQDNGVFNNTTGTWQTLAWFDGYDAVTDITNANIAYVASNGGLLWRTLNGTAWNTINAPPGSSAWIPPLVVDRSNTLYMGKENVWRSYDASGSASWHPLSSWTNRTIRELHLPPLNSSIILAAKDGILWGNPWEEMLYRTDTAHLNTVPTSWTGITYDLPIRYQMISGIASDEKGENVWVSMGNFGGHVYRLDKGSTVWKDMSEGLPNLPVNVIKYWEGSGEDGLFIGSDTGVYYRNKTMSEWRKISCKLPNLPVSDIEINYRTQKLRAAVRGGGLWETSLASIKDQGCAAGSLATVSYNSFSGPQNKELQSGTVITDALPQTTVTVTPRNTCCVEPCNTAPDYSWKVQRIRFPSGALIVEAMGQNSSASFVTKFESGSGGPGSWQRYNYKVEISPRCGGAPCPVTTLYFNRWQ